MREAGVSTLDRLRWAALRMRAIISPRGSFTISPSSPARLHEDGDLPRRTQFTQGDTAHLQLPVERTRTTRHLAAVADAGRRGVPRQLGELQTRLEPLF